MVAEARLRQQIADVVRGHASLNALLSWLIGWWPVVQSCAIARDVRTLYVDRADGIITDAECRQELAVVLEAA